MPVPKPNSASLVPPLFPPPVDIDAVDIRNTLEYSEIVELIQTYSYNKDNCLSVLEDIINVANRKIYNLNV